MAEAWKIIATTERLGGKPDLPPQHEYFLAAFSDQAEALKALFDKRPDLNGSQIQVRGKADQWFIDWLDVQDGQILSIMVVE